MQDPAKVITWTSYANYADLVYPGPGWMSTDHNRGLNVLWADGHASWMKGTEFVSGQPGASIYYYMNFYND